MPYALILIALAIAYRIVAALTPEMANFSPLMALTFCGAVYLRDKRLWLVPFAALILSNLFLNYYYQGELVGNLSAMLLNYSCYAAGLGLGWLVSRHKSWASLACGAFAASLLFYLVTNSSAWLLDPYYPDTLAGWWQAMTSGHPEYPPTLYFFRNSLISDLSFTALFATTLEYAALRAARPSLLRPNTIPAQAQTITNK